MKNKNVAEQRFKLFFIGAFWLSIFGALLGFAVSMTVVGAISGFFVGGWLTMEIGMLIYAANYEESVVA